MSKNMHIPGWPESAAAMPSTGSGAASNLNSAFTNGMAGGMDFIKNFWGNSGTGVPGFVVPTIDLKELEKRIKDLKAVEGWLDVNINMLRTTIQALEVQHSTIASIHAMSDTFSAHTADAAKNMRASMPSASAPSPTFGRAPEPEAPASTPRKRKAKPHVNAGLPPGWPTSASAAPAKAKVKPVIVQPEADVPLSAKPSPAVAAKVPATATSKTTTKAAVTAPPEPSSMARGAEQAAASAGAWLNFLQDQFSKVATTAMNNSAPAVEKKTMAAVTSKASAKTKQGAKPKAKPAAKSRRG